MIIYHNPHCSKSRECLAFLKEEDEQPIEIINYLKNPHSVAQIKELLHKLGIPPYRFGAQERSYLERSRQ